MTKVEDTNYAFSLAYFQSPFVTLKGPLNIAQLRDHISIMRMYFTSTSDFHGSFCSSTNKYPNPF